MYDENIVMEEKKITCENCTVHGFPCLNCAHYIYNGKYGPGFYHHVRVLLYDTQDPNDFAIENIFSWMSENSGIYVPVVYSLDELDELQKLNPVSVKISSG